MSRVVITGMGAISPLGLTAGQMWAGILEGKCGASPIKTFDPGVYPCQIAGQTPEFKTANFVPKSHRKAVKLMARDIELAVIAAKEAVESSGLITKGIDETKVSIDPTRVAVDIGAGFMCCELPEIGPAIARSITDGKFDIHKWGKEGIEAITPLWLLKYLPNMLACHISIIHDLQGPSNTITCAEVSSHIAIAEAMQMIQRGWVDIALGGGGEAKVTPMSILRQIIFSRAACGENLDPATACRPFDAQAKGSIFGEGAGIVVLESLESAQKRGAKIFAELIGTGQSHSLNHGYKNLEPDGKGLQIAIEQAMAQAHVNPDELDMIIPCGTGIAVDDLAESRAINAALGSAGAKIPVLPTKSMLTHTSAASGVLDMIVAISAMKESIIPAARNCNSKAAGINLNINTKPQNRQIRHTLCCGYTYGGQTAALVLKNFAGDK
jgi:3-oxoacyl-[acyl-carrier-protein] synthase II